MSYRLEAGRIYRMPTHFGPAPGPRQPPDGVTRDPKVSHRRLSVAASFLTDAALLERHLPEGGICPKGLLSPANRSSRWNSTT
jgi:hypothetical protein